MVRLARLFTFPYFFKDHEDRALTSTGSQHGFMCTVHHSLSRFDTHLRWPPIMQSSQPQRSYGQPQNLLPVQEQSFRTQGILSLFECLL